MKYENAMTHGICPDEKVACDPAPVESLSDIGMHTNTVASDVLELARRINKHLFGSSDICCEKKAEPQCFRDDLMKTRRTLITAAEELSRICQLLGI